MEARFVAPRTPIEKGTGEIWTEVLGVDQVGIHDNFFELGGDSMLATQLLSRVRDTFQAEVSMYSIFEKPTVAGLAETIEEYLIQQAGTEEVTEILEELDNLSEDEIIALLVTEQDTS